MLTNIHNCLRYEKDLKGKGLEVIFISSDKEEDQFAEYILYSILYSLLYASRRDTILLIDFMPFIILFLDSKPPEDASRDTTASNRGQRSLSTKGTRNQNSPRNTKYDLSITKSCFCTIFGFRMVSRSHERWIVKMNQRSLQNVFSRLVEFLHSSFSKTKAKSSQKTAASKGDRVQNILFLKSILKHLLEFSKHCEFIF